MPLQRSHKKNGVDTVGGQQPCGVTAVPLEPPGLHEVYPAVVASALTIRIPPLEVVHRKFSIPVANISNELFAQQFMFCEKAWRSVSQQSRTASKEFYSQFICQWTAYLEFASGGGGGYLHCTAGSILLNQTVLLGCGMACVACTPQCVTETCKCQTLGHMGSKSCRLLITKGF